MSSPSTIRAAIGVRQASQTDASSDSQTSASFAALTTTFTAPQACSSQHLTILEANAYEIWVAEPVPVPGLLVGTCYPSQFIQGYSSELSSKSSIAPLISPLVCPQNWVTASEFENGYIACCMSGYKLTPPKSLVDFNRPAYGGTCYSEFTLGQTVNVTLYNSTELSATRLWSASVDGAAAYGHVMDGFTFDGITQDSSQTSTSSRATSKSISSQSTTSSAQSAGNEIDTPPAASTTAAVAATANAISGGAIAGIVIGVLALLLLVGLGIFFLLRRKGGRFNRSSPAAEMPAQDVNQKGDQNGFAPGHDQGYGVNSAYPQGNNYGHDQAFAYGGTPMTATEPGYPPQEVHSQSKAVFEKPDGGDERFGPISELPDDNTHHTLIHSPFSATSDFSDSPMSKYAASAGVMSPEDAYSNSGRTWPSPVELEHAPATDAHLGQREYR